VKSVSVERVFRHPCHWQQQAQEYIQLLLQALVPGLKTDDSIVLTQLLAMWEPIN